MDSRPRASSLPTKRCLTTWGCSYQRTCCPASTRSQWWFTKSPRARFVNCSAEAWPFRASRYPSEPCRSRIVPPRQLFQSVPSPSSAARRAGGLTFLGYDLDNGPRRSGDIIHLRLFWRVDRGVSEDYGLTATLRTSDGRSLQSESRPLGRRPSQPVGGSQDERCPPTST